MFNLSLIEGKILKKILKKILIVEDDVTFLGLLSHVLRNQFEIYEACGVNEALKLLENISVDLICSDYNMPGGTGLELLEQLHRSGKKIPFILMSGTEDSFVIHSVKFYGGTFCNKTDSDLLTTIRKKANCE